LFFLIFPHQHNIIIIIIIIIIVLVLACPTVSAKLQT